MSNKVTISELVHKLVVDSTDLDKNLIASRKEISTAKRALRELRNPMEQYEKDLKEAEALLKFGTDGQELYNRSIARAEKRYKSLTGATRAEEQAQERINKDRKKATEIIERQTTRLQRLERELHDVNRLHRNGSLDVRAHRREVDRLNREINETRRGSSFFAQAGQRFGGFLGLDELFGAKGGKVAGQMALLGIGVEVAEKYLQAMTRIAEFGVQRFNTDRLEIDSLAKSSRAIGIEIDRLTGLQFAAGQTSGLDDEQTTKALREITKRSSDAAQGLGESRLAFKELGLSAAELNRLAPDQQLLKIADAIQNVENRSDRFRIAGKLFGEEQAELVTTLERGSDEILKMIHHAEDLGFALTKADSAKIEAVNDSIDGFQRSLVALSRSLTIESSDEIKALVDEATELVHVLLENKDLIGVFFNSTVLSTIEAMTLGLRTINDTFDGMKSGASLISGSFETIGDSIEAVDRRLRNSILYRLSLVAFANTVGAETLSKLLANGPRIDAVGDEKKEHKARLSLSNAIDPTESIRAGSRAAFNIQYRAEVSQQMQIAKDQLQAARQNVGINEAVLRQVEILTSKLSETSL